MWGPNGLTNYNEDVGLSHDPKRIIHAIMSKFPEVLSPNPEKAA